MKRNADTLQRVADLYKELGSAEKVQKHFPDVSTRTIYRWVNKCKATGLL